MRVVGVAGGFGHDASAALIVDGELVALVEEERLTRTKHARDQAAINAILACVHSAGLALSDIDVLALSWDSARNPDNPTLLRAEGLLARSPALAGLNGARRQVFDHHSCHAATAALFCAPSERAVVIVMDGRGETASNSVYLSDSGSLTLLADAPFVTSIGTFYSAATEHCALGYGGQGKTMGLAAYGEAGYDFPQLGTDGIRVTSSFPDDLNRGRHPVTGNSLMLHAWLDVFAEVFGEKRQPAVTLDSGLRQQFSDEYAQRHANAAASAQAKLEILVGDLARNVMAAYPNMPVVLAGGVALNCSANGYLRRSLPTVDLRLFPVPHDSGTSAGAAALAVLAAGGHIQPPNGPYLGIGWSDAQLADILGRTGMTFHEPADLAGLVADRILDGRIIGWFQGRAEVGPRALGHRSILATPFERSVVDRLNTQLKSRERWRPFAPSILEEDMAELFPVSRAAHMIEAHPIRNGDRLPAVTHIDGTSRPHTPDPSFCSPRFHALLTELRSRTGVGAVLNTSFNAGGEPVVYTPQDALRTYATIPLDALVLGPFMVERWQA